MAHIRIFFLLVLATVLITPRSADAAAFVWPDPIRHPRVMLYADQSVQHYMHSHPRWFRHDFLIVGLNIRDVVYGNFYPAIRRYTIIREQLEHINISAASPISGTTALHELSLKHYPANAVSIEDMPVKVRYLGPWMREPDQQVVDLSDPFSRRALLGGIEQLWQHVYGPLRFIDNAAVHPGVVRLQAWENYCQQMKDLRGYAESTLRNNVIFNVFVRPWQLSDKETGQLIAAVAGNGGNAISLPLPWSRSIAHDKNATAWAIYRYRQLLDHRIAVILIPSEEATARELFAWIATWRQPRDHIYVAVPFWQDPTEP